MNIPVIAIDDDFLGIAEDEEVPVDTRDEHTATDNVAEGSGDHAFPDVVFNVDLRVMKENLWFLNQYEDAKKLGYRKLTAKGM